jgi:hypothetical protein
MQINNHYDVFASVWAELEQDRIWILYSKYTGSESSLQELPGPNEIERHDEQRMYAK